MTPMIDDPSGDLRPTKEAPMNRLNDALIAALEEGRIKLEEARVKYARDMAQAEADKRSMWARNWGRVAAAITEPWPYLAEFIQVPDSYDDDRRMPSYQEQVRLEIPGLAPMWVGVESSGLTGEELAPFKARKIEVDRWKLNRAGEPVFEKYARQFTSDAMLEALALAAERGDNRAALLEAWEKEKQAEREAEALAKAEAEALIAEEDLADEVAQAGADEANAEDDPGSALDLAPELPLIVIECGKCGGREFEDEARLIRCVNCGDKILDVA